MRRLLLSGVFTIAACGAVPGNESPRHSESLETEVAEPEGSGQGTHVGGEVAAISAVPTSTSSAGEQSNVPNNDRLPDFPPPMDELCEETGGVYDERLDELCDIPDLGPVDCDPRCRCPEGESFDDWAGCGE